MDNITHTVIGLIAGDAIARVTPADPKGLNPVLRRRVFSAIGMIGGNLPDLDLLYSFRGRNSGKLTYLLGHRGYTHTVFGCMALAALLYIGVLLWLKRRRGTPSTFDRVTLGLWALFATLLHLFMDSLNSYGVHPWWPFDNHWLYGDSIFIVEPLYWAAAAPLLFAFRTTWPRVLIALLLSMGIALSLLTGMVPPLASASLLAVMLVLLVIGARARPLIGSLAAAVTVIAVTALFAVARFAAAERVGAWAHGDFPDDRIVDTVLSPRPADPLCWDALVLQTRGEQYFARSAVVTLMPSLIAATACGKGLLDKPSTAPQSLPAVRARDSVRWREFSMLSADLKHAAKDSCAAAALLRFARAPYALRLESAWIVGDLRFDREKGLGFAELRVAAGTPAQSCPAVEPWLAPRADLLDERW